MKTDPTTMCAEPTAINSTAINSTAINSTAINSTAIGSTAIGRSRRHAGGLVARGLLIVFFCMPLQGCNLLIDEFTWLDRVPPLAEDSPAAASEQ